jgi:hypothetical protein
VTGGYFVNRKPKRSAKASHDQAAAARLWRVSVELQRAEHKRRQHQRLGRLALVVERLLLVQAFAAISASEPARVAPESNATWSWSASHPVT